MSDFLDFVGWVFQKVVVEYRLITWSIGAVIVVACLVGAGTRSRGGAAAAGIAAGLIVFFGLLFSGKAGI